MSALLLLFVCLALGVAVRRFAQPPPDMAHGLNWWVLSIALPALVLELIPGVKPDARLWFPVAAMWITFFGAWLLFAWLGRRLGWSRGRIGALVLVCGFGNTSFMGYPLLQAMHGQAGLALAVVADQLGCFPLLASAGVLVAGVYAGRTADPRRIARRILVFPAFLALLAGTVAGMLGGWPAQIAEVLHSLGGTLTPLALFSVGLQLRLTAIRHRFGLVACGLGWKLLLAPLLCWLLGLAAGVGGLVLTAGVLQAAMAPMISAAILADEYALEPELANTVLGAGIVLSLLTVPWMNLWLPTG